MRKPNKLKELGMDECLKVLEQLGNMTSAIHNVIQGHHEDKWTMTTFQTLLFRDQAKALNEYLVEKFGVLDLDQSSPGKVNKDG